MLYGVTSEDSVISGFGRSLVLGLAGGALVATCGGLVVALHGDAERSWLLYVIAAVLHAGWYALAVGIAENA